MFICTIIKAISETDRERTILNSCLATNLVKLCSFENEFAFEILRIQLMLMETVIKYYKFIPFEIGFIPVSL